MWCILCQASVTEGVVCTGGGIVLTLAAMAIKRGISLRVGNGRSTGSQPSSRTCPVHDTMFRLMDERHNSILAAITKVETGISHIHERLDDALRHKPK